QRGRERRGGGGGGGAAGARDGRRLAPQRALALLVQRVAALPARRRVLVRDAAAVLHVRGTRPHGDLPAGGPAHRAPQHVGVPPAPSGGAALTLAFALAFA
ncbi:Protein of unknown function, partial [Gryllus bimaculatus]